MLRRSVFQVAAAAVDVTRFHAPRDGSALATRALQAAIDEAAKTGGTVHLPPGRYLSGTLFLRSHVRLHLDAGALERVVVSGITMKDVGAPLFVRLGDRARPFVEGQPRPPVGTLRGVQISNIQGTATQKTGCAIAGLPGHPVEDVWLENIRLQFPGGGADTDARRVPPEEADKYPEYKMFGTLPAFGMYCRHVRGLRTQGLALSTAKPDARPAVAYEDVTKGD